MPTQLQHTEVSIDLREISDWASFHAVFKGKMGFPDFYGKNLNAWIDCMTCLDAPEDAMTSVHAPAQGVLVLNLRAVADFKKRCPQIFEALVDCVSFVNYRRMELGDGPVLILAYHE